MLIIIQIEMIKVSIIVSDFKNVSPEKFPIFELRLFLAGLGYNVLTNFIANYLFVRIELLVIRFFRPDPNI